MSQLAICNILTIRYLKHMQYAVVDYNVKLSTLYHSYNIIFSPFCQDFLPFPYFRLRPRFRMTAPWGRWSTRNPAPKRLALYSSYSFRQSPKNNSYS